MYAFTTRYRVRQLRRLRIVPGLPLPRHIVHSITYTYTAVILAPRLGNLLNARVFTQASYLDTESRVSTQAARDNPHALLVWSRALF